MERFLLLAVFCIIWTPLAFSAKWDYSSDANGPAKWPGLCVLDTSKKQTPIDIKTAGATYDQNLGSLTLVNFDNTPANTKFTASNNGYGLKISVPENVYNVSGGGLPGVFTTAQFHLHWGSENNKGSEHFMNGKAYAAEIHFVNYNTKYPNISVAVDKSDGLAVLGVFIEVGKANNTAYSFLDYAKDVVYMDQKKADITPFKFKPMLPTDLTKFFRYPGSLTTPDCFESVTWTVFYDVVKISQDQMDMLRMLKDISNKTLEDNFRPIQDLNNRTVKASFMVPTESTTKGAPPTPTADTSAIKVTAGLFLLMLIAAIFVH